MTKKIFFVSSFLISSLFAFSAKAFCPVCTVAVGAGLGLARWLRIDDAISGLWIGGLLVSVTIWTINWFGKKNIRFKGIRIITALAYYLIVLVPLYFTDVLFHPLNTFWGMDKILLGVILGSVFFLAGALCYNYLKKKNNGHAHFPFQKIAMPVGTLLILSVVFYFLTK